MVKTTALFVIKKTETIRISVNRLMAKYKEIVHTTENKEGDLYVLTWKDTKWLKEQKYILTFQKYILTFKNIFLYIFISTFFFKRWLYIDVYTSIY